MFIVMLMVMLVTMMMHSRPLSHQKYYFQNFLDNHNMMVRLVRMMMGEMFNTKIFTVGRSPVSIQW